MKILTVIAYGLLTFAITASATSPRPEWPNGDGHHGGGGSSVSSQSSIEYINNDSSAASEVVSSNQATVQFKRQEVANSVSSLALPYCGEGGGAGNKSGSFNIGGVTYPCEIAILIPQMLSQVKRLENAANQYPSGSFERNQKLAQASKLEQDVQEILGVDAVKYLHGRSKTAGLGGLMRDSWPILILIGLAL